MSKGSFVHLRLHSEFSLIDGLVRIKPLMKSLEKLQMNAVAVTDYCNLFAAIKVFKAAVDQGIKPIIGSNLPCINFSNQTASSLVVLCLNHTGYRNLTYLISKAYLEGQHLGKPRIDYQWLENHSEGLIALSGAKDGAIGQALLSDKPELALQTAEKLAAIFPNRFYIELQRTNRLEEAAYNEKVLLLAGKLALPIVATNDVRFLEKEDFDAHEARVCIHQSATLMDNKRSRVYSAEQYLRSSEEMRRLFNDLPQAIKNTVEIAKRCTVMLELGNSYLPNFPTPNDVSIEQYLSNLSIEGLKNRLKTLYKQKTAVELAVYDERLTTELAVINSMGFAGYFLIVADFIQWAKNNKVPVGPGRGSGVGSLVAYALNITDLDPLPYELLFERFLNPERVSMPDFDIDFCMKGRDRVIEYVALKYGRYSVSQIITFGTMAAKAVVRDVGRVLGRPYGFVDKLAKLIPFEIGMTLKKALIQEQQLQQRYQEEEEVKELIDLALKLEGIAKNAGKHAGGVVIAPSHLTDFTAIYCEQNSTQILSQFDKDDVEAVGLVKFDFLGLRTLTIIDWTLDIINQKNQDATQSLVEISTIPMDDSATFELLKNCQTTAVFQLESRGMKEIIHRLQPDCFEEIIALVALFRPGPLQSGMVDDFINRKHGKALVEYPHPELEAILKPTYGVILYQEQVMQIAQVLANFTLGSADLLRRAMGKKKPEEMAKQRLSFISGAKLRGIEEKKAAYIFDLMEKFAGYGFNKAHAAAYALLAYQTAWLKSHFPAAFMAAVMSSDMDNTEKTVTFIHEAHQMQLKVLPPCINRSHYSFTVENDKTIIYGLGAIKGVGQTAAELMVAERQQGHYSSLFDFCQRMDGRKVNRRCLEALIKSGAMDAWQIDRASLLASVDTALKLAEKSSVTKTSGQADLFDLWEEDKIDYTSSPPLSEIKRLVGERETLGLYFTGHPAEQYSQELSHVTTFMKQLQPQVHKKPWVCGQVTAFKRIITKTNKQLFVLTLEDHTAKIDAVVFAELLTSTDIIDKGAMAVLEGEIAYDNYNGRIRMTVSQIKDIAAARLHFAKCLRLTMTAHQLDCISALQSLLQNHVGQCAVQILYKNNKNHACLNLSADWKVHPSDELLHALYQLLGLEQVQIIYREKS